MEKLQFKEFKKILKHAFKAGRISVNTSFEQWFETFMNVNGYKSVKFKSEKNNKKLSLENSQFFIEKAIKRGFVKGVSYTMDDKKYKIKGDLFVRAMYKFAQGTEDEAIDYYVINHEKSNGCVYNGKTNEWAKILNKK